MLVEPLLPGLEATTVRPLPDVSVSLARTLTTTALSSLVVAASLTASTGWLAGSALVQLENSELLLFGSVAVAVIAEPAATGAAKVGENVALPLPSVVTSAKPRKLWPSPLPDTSQAGLE